MIGYQYCFGTITFYDDKTLEKTKKFAMKDVHGIRKYLETLTPENREFLNGAVHLMKLELDI